MSCLSPAPLIAAAPHPALPDADEPTLTIHAVARLLGARPLSDVRLCRYVQDLVDNAAFPSPFPAPRHGGGLNRAVARNSRWPRAAVVAWAQAFLPDFAQAAEDAATRAAAAAEMDAAAAMLGGRRLPRFTLHDGGKA